MYFILTLILWTVVQAHEASVQFRGLNIRHMVQPYALYYLRSAFACHYGVPVAAVRIDSVSWFNETHIVQPEYNINEYVEPRPIPCPVLAATHWDDGGDPDSALKRILLVQEPVTISVQLDMPIGATRPYKLNLLPYLATAADESFADLLHAAPELFTDVGDLPTAPRLSLSRLLGKIDLKVTIMGVLLLHFGGAMCLVCIAHGSRKSKPKFAGLNGDVCVAFDAVVVL